MNGGNVTPVFGEVFQDENMGAMLREAYDWGAAAFRQKQAPRHPMASLFDVSGN